MGRSSEKPKKILPHKQKKRALACNKDKLWAKPAAQPREKTQDATNHRRRGAWRREEAGRPPEEKGGAAKAGGETTEETGPGRRTGETRREERPEERRRAQERRGELEDAGQERARELPRTEGAAPHGRF